ncbi:dnaJ domain-containing protein [Artemisia annua]|uniref:DnaJ domain-containing protein n=1 Tax=Artemisia annua TaxID=35608 RepID=A0A2U1MRT7_ARTAN|nr:dnaJ domain-containing protein [Artemisia annua]
MDSDAAFREILSNSPLDVWGIIDAAITLALKDYSDELKLRRAGIVERLNDDEHKSDSDSDEENARFVPLNEFRDFDKHKEEHCFKADQFWAVYDGFDRMPRSYIQIRKVHSSPFRLEVIWLVAVPESPEEIVWAEEGLPDWDIKWSSNPESYMQFKYEIVEVLSDFDKEHGILIAYMVKVEGFVSVFRRTSRLQLAECCIPSSKLFKFSHYIPSLKLTGTERADYSCGTHSPHAPVTVHQTHHSPTGPPGQEIILPHAFTTGTLHEPVTDSCGTHSPHAPVTVHQTHHSPTGPPGQEIILPHAFTTGTLHEPVTGELEEYDSQGIELYRLLALKYSKQLFPIYQKERTKSFSRYLNWLGGHTSCFLIWLSSYAWRYCKCSASPAVRSIVFSAKTFSRMKSICHDLDLGLKWNCKMCLISSSACNEPGNLQGSLSSTFSNTLLPSLGI